MTIKAGDWVICVTSCGLDATGRSPTPTLAYRVLKADSLWVYPEGFVDGWRIESFRKFEGFDVGDYVRCVDEQCSIPRLEPGALYEVSHIVGGRICLKGIDCASGFFAHRFNLMRRPSKKFGDLSNALKTVVETQVDWEASYHAAKRAEKAAQTDLDRALERNVVLSKELAAERTAKHINPKYVEDLESFRTAVHHVVERKPNGESGVEACQRIVAEHKRMKRQLELAESYNFDRKGLKDDETIRDLYNYVLVALGKKPLDFTGWVVMRVSRFFKDLDKRKPIWKTPVFDNTGYDHFDVFYRVQQPLDYIPLNIVVNDCQDEKAPNPTGCVELCSHPDCKKGIK